MMRLIKKVIAISVLLMFSGLPMLTYGQAASASGFDFSGGTADNYGLRETQNKFNALANFAFYAMYLCGGVVLCGAAFKLKQGDVPGFAKMAAGGGLLFTIPTIMGNLVSYSNK